MLYQPSIDPDPRLTLRLLSQHEFLSDPLRVLDGGARHGVENIWTVFGDQARIFAFEPDGEESQRLNAASGAIGAPATRYLPMGLAGRKGRRDLHVARLPDSSSFFAVDANIASRYGMFDAIEQIGCEPVAAIDIPSFLATEDIHGLDAIKLDIEGAELEVLERCREMLSRDTVAVLVEVWFQPVHIDRPHFSQIDRLLTTCGFQLFDLREVSRWRRVSLGERGYPAATGAGQLMYANGIYLRDLPGRSTDAPSPSRRTVLALASIAEVLCYPDFAAEVLVSSPEAVPLDEARALVALLYHDRAAPPRWHGPARRVVRRALPSGLRRRLVSALARLLTE